MGWYYLLPIILNDENEKTKSTKLNNNFQFSIPELQITIISKKIPRDILVLAIKMNLSDLIIYIFFFFNLIFI